MERMRKTCGNCGGQGVNVVWKIVESDGETNTMERTEMICSQCNGTGYTEYAVFSIEEAEAILMYMRFKGLIYDTTN
jgi:DnaJ-class molecular chaperone